MGKLDTYLGTVTILDGGWGSEFQKLGLEPGESCERWNLEAPEHVLTVAKSYVDAGSDAILTNSFQGNAFTLERHGLADKVFDVNRRAAELSREAAGSTVKVFGSMGPSGKMFMMGDISDEELKASFAEQIRGLVAGGVDAIVLETFADIEEWKAVASAVKSRCSLPVVGSMTFDSGPDHCRTMMGVTVQQAIEAGELLGLDAVGANCGVGIEAYIEIARQFREGTDLPVWIKANAGLPEQRGSETVYAQTARDFADYVDKLVALGVNFMGGCCGTTPDFIRELVRRRG